MATLIEQHKNAVSAYIQTQGLEIKSITQEPGFYATECAACHKGVFYYRWGITFFDPELQQNIDGAAISIRDSELGTGIMGPLKGPFSESAVLLASTICQVCNPKPKLLSDK